MTELTISFLFFDGCPLAPRARDNVVEAIENLDPDVRTRFEEVNLMAHETPEDLKRWGSPTILINGEDISGGEKGWACSCRLYASDEGVPTTAEIIEAIGNRKSI